MTTKEIAEAVGKTERSVRNWTTKVAENNSVVAEKVSASSPMHPADYDLEETILIIETGLGKNAADLYRMSAQQQTQTTAVSTQTADEFDAKFDKMLQYGMMMTESLNTTVQAMQTAVQSMVEVTTQVTKSLEHTANNTQQLPAPKVKPTTPSKPKLIKGKYTPDQAKKKIKKMVNEVGSVLHGDHYYRAWKDYYNRFLQQTGIDVRSKGKAPLDIIADEGLLDTGIDVIAEMRREYL